MEKFKSQLTNSKAVLTVDVDNGAEGAYFMHTGPHGVSVSIEDAKRIRDMLIERYGLPKRQTFAEQFAKLEIGQSFTIKDGPNDPRPWPSIKVSDTQYFESSYKRLRAVEFAFTGWTITV